VVGNTQIRVPQPPNEYPLSESDIKLKKEQLCSF